MEPLVKHTGLVVPLDRSNIDTDAIIPKQFLKSIQREGFGENLFDEWRYLDEGQPGIDNSKRPLNSDFILNKSTYKSASILLTRNNFGCGSSREHAVWALVDYGFKVIVAESFADIFYNNAIKNGLLPVVLKNEEIARLFETAHKNHGLTVTVDLSEQLIKLNNGVIYHFDIEPFPKYCLQKGLDEIGLSLEKAEKIKAYEERRRNEAPWLFGV